ncbi:hypothetical protein FYJ74_04565 [Pyramidobacter sp. SM-530-WT-4B]|uniref:Uncharacterized protein n=1 Tax=Pyramidobacter porci TaxID=2605789 RepID=A0A6L5YAJ2_9BACT|nr:hypothetical protein [Pyramidobacter porci]RKJ80418.1 hypothetical protein D7D26_03305 [Pyramidobacter sp. CG50-2]
MENQGALRKTSSDRRQDRATRPSEDKSTSRRPRGNGPSERRGSALQGRTSPQRERGPTGPEN